MEVRATHTLTKRSVEARLCHCSTPPALQRRRQATCVGSVFARECANERAGLCGFHEGDGAPQWDHVKENELFLINADSGHLLTQTIGQRVRLGKWQSENKRMMIKNLHTSSTIT